MTGQDRIILGTAIKKVADTAKAKPNMSLKDIQDLCKALEASSENEETAEAVHSAQRHTLQKFGTEQPTQRYHPYARGRGHRGQTHGRPKGPSRGMSRGGHHSRGSQNGGAPARGEKPAYLCQKGNTWHTFAKCPAHGKKCLRRGEVGHYMAVCKKPTGEAVASVSVAGSSKASGETPILDVWAAELEDVEKEVREVPLAEDDAVLGKPPPEEVHDKWAETIMVKGFAQRESLFHHSTHAYLGLPAAVFCQGKPCGASQ
ncbi:hypothetical protein ONE63_001697 [Megalurothrips usitatus]|uniref:Uncharacterized protein n=1 Tax=Megalurothrips usitatus TaxID=439358 RepID=A0AAV7XD44_9NEOP|nr:hypothetical protein ONE63_001697 [Megalurothrips usitatus]